MNHAIRSINFNGKNIVSSSGETILESLEKSGVIVNYECRNGFCGACKCKLYQGKVNVIKDTLAYTSNNEILICSATPETDIVLADI